MRVADFNKRYFEQVEKQRLRSEAKRLGMSLTEYQNAIKQPEISHKAA